LAANEKAGFLVVVLMFLKKFRHGGVWR